MKYIDVHAHLEEEIFDKDRELILKECKEKEITIINVGSKPQANRKVLELKAKHPQLFIGLGIYPLNGIEMTDKEFFDELKFIEQNKDKLCCIGEVGIDFYWIKDEAQKLKEIEQFSELIWLANKLNLPLNVHSRNAEELVLQMILKSAHVPSIMHSYGGDPILAKALIKQDIYFSIPPLIIRSKKLQKLAEILPIEKILTETDAPYQGPTSERNDPRNIPLVIKKIAEIKKMQEEEVRLKILENAQKIFKGL